MAHPPLKFDHEDLGVTPRRARLRPHERLRDSKDFQRAFARRRVVSDPRLSIHPVENQRDCARLGISVPRKLARSSVTRHRLKRLVREAFRQNKARFAPGIDYVVVVRVIAADSAGIAESLNSLAPQAAARLRRGGSSVEPEAP